MSIEEEPARGEIGRVRSMAGLGLAVEVMRAWRADPGRSLSRAEIAGWLLRDYPAGARLVPLLRGVVRSACDALTEDGLLEERRLSGFVVGPDGAAGGAVAQLAPTARARLQATGSPGNCPPRQADDTYPSLVTF